MTVVNVDFTRSRFAKLRHLGRVPQVQNGPGTPVRLINDYLRSRCLSWSSNTTRTYATHLDQFGAWLGKNRGGLLDLDDHLLAEFAFSLAKNRSLEPTTCIDSLATVQRFVNWGVSYAPESFPALQRQSPAALYESAVSRQKILPRKINSAIPRFIPKDPATQFVAALGHDRVQGVRNQLLGRLMLEAGLRVTEATTFPISALPNLMPNGKSAIVSIVGKGSKKRFVILPWSLHQDLLEYAALERKHFLECLKSRSVPNNLFISAEGKPISSARVQQIFRETSQRVGIKVTPHQLRHTFATYDYLEHKDLVRLKKLLGHAFLDTTQIYVGFSVLVTHTDELRRQLIAWERPNAKRATIRQST